MTRFLVVAILLAASTAHAETDQPTREPAAAIGLSVGATLVPAVLGMALDNRSPAISVSLVVTGCLIGPSIGHWYSGKILTHGLALRALGTAVIGFGYVVARSSRDEGEFIDNNGFGIALGGLTMILVGAAVDWGSAGDSARAYNARVRPTVTAIHTSTGTHAGLGFAGSF